METIDRSGRADARRGPRQRFGHRSGLTLAVVLGGAAAACGSAVAPTNTATTAQSASLARPSGPYSVGLQAHVRGSCQTGDYAGSSPVVGHVSVVRDATGTVSADVTMDHGRPNQSYEVELVHTPNSIPYSPVSRGQPTRRCSPPMAVVMELRTSPRLQSVVSPARSYMFSAAIRRWKSSERSTCDSHDVEHRRSATVMEVRACSKWFTQSTLS